MNSWLQLILSSYKPQAEEICRSPFTEFIYCVQSTLKLIHAFLYWRNTRKVLLVPMHAAYCLLTRHAPALFLRKAQMIRLLASLKCKGYCSRSAKPTSRKEAGQKQSRLDDTFAVKPKSAIMGCRGHWKTSVCFFYPFGHHVLLSAWHI